MGGDTFFFVEQIVLSFAPVLLQFLFPFLKFWAQQQEVL